MGDAVQKGPGEHVSCPVGVDGLGRTRVNFMHAVSVENQRALPAQGDHERSGDALQFVHGLGQGPASAPEQGLLAVAKKQIHARADDFFQAEPKILDHGRVRKTERGLDSSRAGQGHGLGRGGTGRGRGDQIALDVEKFGIPQGILANLGPRQGFGNAQIRVHGPFRVGRDHD